MDPLRPQTIEAIALVISGGSDSGHHVAPDFTQYRKASEIKQFLSAFGIDYELVGRSRVPVLIERLQSLNEDEQKREVLLNCIAAAVHPSGFMNDRPRLEANVSYLNEHLLFDGLRVRIGSTRAYVHHLRPAFASKRIEHHVETLNLDTVHRDFERALDSVSTDPEDAITAACSMLESILRSIIVALNEELPVKKDLSSLYKVVREKLRLSPQRSDMSLEIADDVKIVLGGLTSCVSGIAALRTHAGDAHGRESGHGRVDSRIALLAINAASTLGLFLIETWQMRFPTTPLRSMGSENGPTSVTEKRNLRARPER